MPFPSITHVAVTVSDIDRSTSWYQKLFDAEPVLDGHGHFAHKSDPDLVTAILTESGS